MDTPVTHRNNLRFPWAFSHRTERSPVYLEESPEPSAANRQAPKVFTSYAGCLPRFEPTCSSQKPRFHPVKDFALRGERNHLNPPSQPPLHTPQSPPLCGLSAFSVMAYALSHLRHNLPLSKPSSFFERRTFVRSIIYCRLNIDRCQEVRGKKCKK